MGGERKSWKVGGTGGEPGEFLYTDPPTPPNGAEVVQPDDDDPRLHEDDL